LRFAITAMTIAPRRTRGCSLAREAARSTSTDRLATAAPTSRCADPSAEHPIADADRADPSDARLARWSAWAGWVHFCFSRYDHALREFRAARELARRLGDTLLEHGCMAGEFDVHFFEGRFAEAEQLARRVLDACLPDDPRWAQHGSTPPCGRRRAQRLRRERAPYRPRWHEP
jgi:hypothetical protein